MVQRKARLMLTFEGDPSSADYLLDEWAESLPYLAHVKAHHSGFRSQKRRLHISGSTRRWMRSDQCLRATASTGIFPN